MSMFVEFFDAAVGRSSSGSPVGSYLARADNALVCRDTPRVQENLLVCCELLQVLHAFGNALLDKTTDKAAYAIWINLSIKCRIQNKC